MKRSQKPSTVTSRLAPHKKSVPLNLTSVNNDFTSLPSSSFVHGIPHCPVYYPTMQEFADPIAYISKIKPEAEKSGICKIVPPREWKPDFALNSETFRFKTRKQVVNSMEGRTRVNINFLETLQKFHALNGNPIGRMPSLNKKPLDIYKLRHEVKKRGGFHQVCEARKWSEIGRSMGYGANHTSLASSLKTCYTKYLMPFEEYLEHHGEAASWETLPLQPLPENANEDLSADGTRLAKVEDSLSLTPATTLQTTDQTNESSNQIQSTNTLPMPDSQITVPTPETQSDDTTKQTSQSLDAYEAMASDTMDLDGAPLSQDGEHHPHTLLSHTQSHSEVNSSGLAEMMHVDKQSTGDTVTSLLNCGTSGSNGSGGSKVKMIKPKVAIDCPEAAKNIKRKPLNDVMSPKYRVPPEAYLPPVPLPEGYQPKKGEEVCEICGHGHNRQLMAVCDDCNRGFHAFCLTPPLINHPRSLPEWYCFKCVAETGNDFGFEDGSEYSLTEFQAVANKFKEEWFRDRAKGDAQSYGLTLGSKWLYVTEEEIEREFWRITESPFETVEVEYGADLHSSVHGSGFPTTERNPMNSYATDPANLNCLPLSTGSLFSNIKADISGMMIPWLYIGMCLSTFCWHAEDHWLYSANYQHWGDTKTWYGIPESDLDKFEQAMRAAVPKLFEKNPDLLFHITTTLSPAKLTEAGVKVYGCHQRAGEFVISFPAAYHAGFNHGFNCNEAVNFAPHDWLDNGLACVTKYKQFNKAPVFSHDELLIATAQKDGSNLTVATWLARHLRDMIQCDEDAIRIISEILPPGYRMIVDEVALPEDQHQCCVCNSYCHLASVKCSCTTKVACYDHILQLCSCHLGSRFVRRRYSSQALHNIVQRVIDVASVPEKWVASFRSLMAQHSVNNTRPQLQELQTLLYEGEQIPCIIDEAVNLKNFLEGALDWVERASRLLKKVPARKKEKDRQHTKRSMEDYEKLLDDGDALCFECMEMEQLRQFVGDINRLRDRARHLHYDGLAASVEECRELLAEIARVDVDIPETELLRSLLRELDWRSRVNAEDELADYDRITAILDEAARLGLTKNDDVIQALHTKRLQGEAWNMRAQSMLIMDKIDLKELEDVAKSALNSCGQKALQLRISDLFGRVQDWRASAEALMDTIRAFESDQPPKHKKRPTADDLRQVLARVQILPIQPPEPYPLINMELRRIESWSIKAKRLFVKPSIPKDLTNILAEFLNAMEPVADVQYDTFFPRNDRRRRVVCFCRQVEAGFMLTCEVCHEAYHSNCVKISRKEARKTTYVCHVCDLIAPVPRRGNNTSIAEVRRIYEEGQLLAFQPSELHILEAVLNKSESFQRKVQDYLSSKGALEWAKGDVGQVKFYLRKAEGLDIAIPEVERLRDLVAELAAYIPQLRTEDELLCFCQQEYSPHISMVCCDVCDDWFHFGCTNLTAETVQDEEHYMCPMCCYKRSVSYKFGDVTIPPSYPPFLAYLTAKSNTDEKLLEEARAAQHAKDEQRRLVEEQKKRTHEEEVKRRRAQANVEKEARKRKRKAEAKLALLQASQPSSANMSASSSTSSLVPPPIPPLSGSTIMQQQRQQHLKQRQLQQHLQLQHQQSLLSRVPAPLRPTTPPMSSSSSASSTHNMIPPPYNHSVPPPMPFSQQHAPFSMNPFHTAMPYSMNPFASAMFSPFFPGPSSNTVFPNHPPATPVMPPFFSSPQVGHMVSPDGMPNNDGYNVSLSHMADGDDPHSFPTDDQSGSKS